jgi:hypothetical protein
MSDDLSLDDVAVLRLVGDPEHLGVDGAVATMADRLVPISRFLTYFH